MRKQKKHRRKMRLAVQAPDVIFWGHEQGRSPGMMYRENGRVVTYPLTQEQYQDLQARFERRRKLHEGARQ